MGAVLNSRRTGSGAPAEFRQDTAAAVWTIIHNLNCRPPVSVILDSAPTEPVWPDIAYPNDDTVTLTFDTAVTGGVTI